MKFTVGKIPKQVFFNKEELLGLFETNTPDLKLCPIEKISAAIDKSGSAITNTHDVFNFIKFADQSLTIYNNF